MQTKTFILTVAAALATGSLQAENDMKLTNRQQALVAIAANEATGNIAQLRVALDNGLEQDLTVSEAKEALSQLYAYTGFPRSLNALGALQQVVNERQQAGRRVVEGREADAMAPDYDALRQGTEVQTRLTGTPFNYTFAPQTDYYLKAHLFGDIFARNNLTYADRELVTVSAIACLKGCEPQLKAHVSGALNMGVTQQELCSIPYVLVQQQLIEEAARLRGVLEERFNLSAMTLCSEEQTKVDDLIYRHKCEHFEEFETPWPKGEPNSAYAQYFIGNSYVAPLDAQNGRPVNVTFEPRCRNNWHIHHNQVQVLVCVAGRGWYQEWGKEAVQMTPGTVIAIPAETKHWHGAAKDSWFQHLTYHTHVGEGASNEWLEPVVDEVYNKLK